VNENVLPGGALDETVSFSPVEPLDCALLSHKELLSPLLNDLTFAFLREASAPLLTPFKGKTKAQPARGRRKKSRPKKSPISSNRGVNHGTNFRSDRVGATYDCKTRAVYPKLQLVAPNCGQRATDNIHELKSWQAKKSEI
jgi:hypothetical protein